MQKSGVRVPLSPPRRSKLCIACSDFFIKKSERAHAAAPPFPQTVTLGSPARLQAPSLRLAVATNRLRAGTPLLIFANIVFYPPDTNCANPNLVGSVIAILLHHVEARPASPPCPSSSAKSPPGSPARLQAPSLRLAVATNRLRAGTPLLIFANIVFYPPDTNCAVLNLVGSVIAILLITS